MITVQKAPVFDRCAVQLAVALRTARHRRPQAIRRDPGRRMVRPLELALPALFTPVISGRCLPRAGKHLHSRVSSGQTRLTSGKPRQRVCLIQSIGQAGEIAITQQATTNFGTPVRLRSPCCRNLLHFRTRSGSNRLAAVVAPVSWPIQVPTR